MNETQNFFILLLLTLSLGATMSTISNLIPAYIAPSSRFHGCYDVVTYEKSRGVNGLYTAFSQKRIPCANIASARTVKREINAGTYDQPTETNETPKLSAEQLGGCLTGGLGYTPAVTWLATGRTEQVTNWATARQLKRNYPAQPEQVFASVLA